MTLREKINYRIRLAQRYHWLPLQESANATAVRFHLSLSENGYGPSTLDDGSKFKVLFLVKSEDLDLWLANLTHLSETYKDQIISVTAILEKFPSSSIFEQISIKGFPVEIITEEEFDKDLRILKPQIEKYARVRQPWIKQQVIKTLYVARQDSPVLILDSDTFIMKPMAFLNPASQLLLCGSDFHSPYSRHIKKFLGIIPTATSFVHHCQLQTPAVLKEIYGEQIIQGINKWLASGIKLAEYSAVSEFQTYGDYILNWYPEAISIYFHQHHEVPKSEIKGQLDKYLSGHRLECNCDLLTLTFK